MTEEYTSTASRVVFAIQGGVYGLAAGAAVLGLVDGTPLVYPGYALLVALVAAGGWRGASVTVTADSKRIVVRNLFSTYTVHRADVLRVGSRELMATSPGTRRCPALYVRGRRRPIKLSAMTPWGPAHQARFEPVLRRWGSARGDGARRPRRR